MSETLPQMMAFVAAVEEPTFAAAAARLKVSPTLVGLRIKALEARLGVRLLNRSTRRKSLTEAGRIYHARCKAALAEVAAADASVMTLQAVPVGRLKVTAPVSFGVHALTAVVSAYLERHPGVAVDLNLTDRTVDLIEEGFEVALRVGPLEDSSLLARRLRPYAMMVCAAPEYLDRHGEPRQPEDLRDHNCLSFSQWRRHDRWRFERGGEPLDVEVSGSLDANSGEALRIAALRGVGVVMQPAILLSNDVGRGALTPLLTGYLPPPRSVHLVFHPDRRPTPKLQAFIDLAREMLG